MIRSWVGAGVENEGNSWPLGQLNPKAIPIESRQGASVAITASLPVIVHRVARALVPDEDAAGLVVVVQLAGAHDVALQRIAVRRAEQVPALVHENDLAA